jgi:hypothetical protein
MYAGCGKLGIGIVVAISRISSDYLIFSALGKGRANGEFLHYETKYLNQGIARIKTI